MILGFTTEWVALVAQDARLPGLGGAAYDETRREVYGVHRLVHDVAL